MSLQAQYCQYNGIFRDLLTRRGLFLNRGQWANLPRLPLELSTHAKPQLSNEPPLSSAAVSPTVKAMLFGRWSPTANPSFRNVFRGSFLMVGNSSSRRRSCRYLRRCSHVNYYCYQPKLSISEHTLESNVAFCSIIRCGCSEQSE